MTDVIQEDFSFSEIVFTPLSNIIGNNRILLLSVFFVLDIVLSSLHISKVSE